VAPPRLSAPLALAVPISAQTYEYRTCKLIRQMWLANPLWGAPRIHGELLKLGIKIS